jgi:predicted nuclease with TOPRIM domain
MTPRHITLEKTRELREHIQANCPDEPELLADMMEGETDLYEWMGWIERKRLADSMLIEGLKKTQADLAARKKRLDARDKAWRNMGAEMLHAAGIGKVELPTATWSPTRVKPKRIVVDEGALPDDCVKITREPDMAAINALPEMPDGVSMDNGRDSVVVRVK